jgi:hypothetical protein
MARKAHLLQELRILTVELAYFGDCGRKSECGAFEGVRCAGASAIVGRDALRNQPGINRTTPTRSHRQRQQTVEENGQTPASGMGLV